eukprot:6457769-Amphidinium_carterae.1
MPALKTTKQTTLEEQAMGETCQLLASILAEHEEVDGEHGHAESTVQKRQRRKQTHVSSYDILRAWDHQLALLGKGLGDFKPYNESSKPLAEEEIRYIVDTAAWPGYTLPEGVSWKRFAIKNLSNNSKRFEVPVAFEGGSPSCLIVNCDECGANLAPLQFATNHLSMRVVWLRDAAHRTWRDFRLAVADNDMWPFIYDIMHVLGVPQGPWHSAQWYRGVVEACEQHFAEEGYKNPLFQALLPELLAEMRSQHKLSEEEGSQEEEQEAWAVLQTSNLLTRRSNRVTLTRWFEVVDRWAEFDKEYFAHHYCYCLYLWKTGVFSSIEDMPIWGLRTFQLRSKPTKAKQTGKHVTMQEASAQEILETERVQAKNAIHLASNILGQPGMQRSGKVMLQIGQVLYSAFSKEQQACSTAGATAKYQMSYAQHGYSMVFTRIFGRLRSVASLRACLLCLGTPPEDAKDFYSKACPSSATTPSTSTSSSTPVLTEPLLMSCLKPMPGDELDFEVGESMWALAASTVKQRGMSICNYTSSLLGYFVLLKGNADVASECLRTLRKWWQCLVWVEPRRHKHAELMKVFNKIGFLQNVVIREMMVTLAQHDFQVVPPNVMSVVEGMYQGFANTILVERCFQALRDEKRKTTGSVMSRQRRWMVPVQRELLTSMGWPEVVADENISLPSSVAKQSYGQRCFEALGLEPTWDDAELAEIKGERQTWLSTSAQGLQLQVAAWQLLVTASADEDETCIDNAWQNVLCPEGVILHAADESSKGWLCLKSSCYGLLVWPMVRRSMKELSFWRPVTEEGTKVHWMVMRTLKQWHCCQIQPVPPVVLSVLAATRGEKVQSEIAMWQKGSSRPILEMAAVTAFKTCTSEVVDRVLKHMTDFHTTLAMKDRPKGLYNKLDWLIRSVLPTVSEEELKQIFLTRVGLHEVRSQSMLMSGENLDVSAGCLDIDDLKDAETFKKSGHAAGVSLKHQTLEFLLERKYLDRDAVRKSLRGMEPPVRD